MFRWAFVLALAWALVVQGLFMLVVIDDLRRDLTYGERHLRTILCATASVASWVILVVVLVRSVVSPGFFSVLIGP